MLKSNSNRLNQYAAFCWGVWSEQHGTTVTVEDVEAWDTKKCETEEEQRKAYQVGVGIGHLAKKSGN